MLSMLPSGVDTIGDRDRVHRGPCDLYDEEDEFLDVEDHADDGDIKHDGKKSSKPVMEKRRRARINSCLDELKSIIVDALNKDPSRHSKLEKADILEMTVKHLQQVQRRQLGSAVSRDPSVLQRFRGGFAECAQEVTRYVSRIESVDNGVKQRLVNHLGQCVSGLQTMTPVAFAAMTGVLPPANAAAPHMRPQFPPQQPLYEEPKGSHARALQNLMLARAEAARNLSLPPNLVPKNPNLRHVVPTDKPKQTLPASTPNVSPQTLSSSLPVTPQSAKLSPSSSSSSLSPDNDSQSPTNQGSKSMMQNDKLYSVKMPIRPSHPSIQMKLEEPVLGQLFSGSNRSAFTAVKNFSHQHTAQASTSSSQQYTESSSFAGNSTKYNIIPGGIVAPTARRLAPPVNIETKFALQKRLSLQVKDEPRANVGAPNNRETNSEVQKRYSCFSNHVNSTPSEFPQGPVPTYRKRSLDSLVEENSQCKKMKIEVLRDTSASCPGPIGQLVVNNNGINNNNLTNNHSNDSRVKNINNNINNNIFLAQQRQNIIRDGVQEEKDMWRPW